jgi:glycosyltransferase involved in cell wall biosynthesis
MRLVIVDQSFEGLSGHHAEYTLCIAKEAAKQARVTVLANQRCEVKSSEGIEIQPNFRLPWTQTQRARPPALYDPTVSFPAWSFLADLRRGLDRIGLSPQDHVFVHSIGFTEIEDLLTYAMTTDRARLPVFDILLRRDLDEISGDEPGFQRFVAYLKAFAGLGFAPEAARFFTDTEELSEHYTTVTGIRFTTLGIAFDQDAMRTALAALSPKTADEPLIVGYLGDARPEKGYQFLHSVAETLMQSHLSNAKARLRLQSNFHLPGGETLAMPEARHALERFGPAVELLYDPLNQDEYYRQLAEMDIVVLPYMSERYRRRSSGIFVQAAAAGKVVVLPRGTTMCVAAQRYAMGNCVFYDAPEELPEAVAQAIDRHDSLRTAVTSYQDRWCAANSPAALVGTILGESAGAHTAPREGATPLVLHVIDGQSMHFQTGIAKNQYVQRRFLQASGYRVATVFLVRSFPSDYDLAAWVERNYRYWFSVECVFSWLVYFTQPPSAQRPGSLQGELSNSELLSVPETLRGLIASGAVDMIWANDVTSVPFLRSLGARHRVPILCEAHALQSFQEDELALELSLLADCDIVNSQSGSDGLLIANRLGPSRVITLSPPILGEPLAREDIAGYFDGLSEAFGRLLGDRPEWKFVDWVGRSPSPATVAEAALPDPRSVLLGVGDEAIAMDLSTSMPGLGWYPTGPGEEGRHRWTGPEARFTLELFLPEQPYRCWMELLPSRSDNLDNFSIRLNDKIIPHQFSEKDGKILIEFSIPARDIYDHLQLGIFVFQHGSVFRPTGVADERLLGCAVCSIRFERQESDRGRDRAVIPGDRNEPQPGAGEALERNAEIPINGRALIIDDSVPEPDKDAGSNAVLQHILSLQRLGYSVSFIPADNMARIDPYTADLEQRGVECFHRPRYTSVGDVLLKHAAPFDLVYLHRHSNASKYGGAIRDHSPEARVIYPAFPGFPARWF